MATKTYSYDPAQLVDPGRDRMRFELGDVMVEGGVETTALTDEEIDAVLLRYPKPDQWRRAKLALVESILFRFSYEVDTKVGPLSLSLAERVSAWRQLRDELRKGLAGSMPPVANPAALGGVPYFFAGMMDNPPAANPADRKAGGGHDVP